MPAACSIRVRGVVQGVGFRPFVYRLASANTLTGWVLNAGEGVEIHLEGSEQGLEAFLRELKAKPPAAASITAIEIEPASAAGFDDFTIRESLQQERPTVRISPDLPICDDCLSELFDPNDRRHGYPYINCTNCGPRYTVITSLPYDRPNTTMREWPLDAYCSAEYQDPRNRRFHAQPVACPNCGPAYYLHEEGKTTAEHREALLRAVRVLNDGKIVAIKGLGGYHLACSARDSIAVAAMRARKFRKEKPFAVMVRDLTVARQLVALSANAEALLTSAARPIVLAPAKVHWDEVAPDNDELGVMLPYTPLHHLLFAAGAPDVLVMTSANRSSEPIAYEDSEALERLSGIADAFLIGQRPIARRVDDSVARAGPFGPVILRRARGYSPGAVTTFPIDHSILALGADLKNTITLVVDGQAFVSQHLGDLEDYESFVAFQQTIQDLVTMYEVPWEELVVVHDAHPQYLSTGHAVGLAVRRKHAVQHHRAHIASVLAERGEWQRRVVGVSFDGTGYGDDGSIWGGEIFAGSLQDGFERVAHLRSALLAGGDAAAMFPVQAAAGFLAQIDQMPDVLAEPFSFPKRYRTARQMVAASVRTFATSSVGRLFDAAAALLGFVRGTSFEGQAAMWLEHLAHNAQPTERYPFPFADGELDFRPLLGAVMRDRRRGRDLGEIARAFHGGVAGGVRDAVAAVCESRGLNTVVLSGGVFQNAMLMEDLDELLGNEGLEVWTNREVPPNDGGISLGQAALSAFTRLEAGS
jgi:hydrogenase maturation protein HypF